MLSLTTLEWTKIEVAPVGARPSARAYHTMTSVGLDLWVYGGTTYITTVTPVISDELWRFSTSTHLWQRVDTIRPNEARPIARTGHTMTSVGLDLWVFGGSTPYGTGTSGEGCWY